MCIVFITWHSRYEAVSLSGACMHDITIPECRMKSSGSWEVCSCHMRLVDVFVGQKVTKLHNADQCMKWAVTSL